MLLAQQKCNFLSNRRKNCCKNLFILFSTYVKIKWNLILDFSFELYCNNIYCYLTWKASNFLLWKSLSSIRKASFAGCHLIHFREGKKEAESSHTNLVSGKSITKRKIKSERRGEEEEEGWKSVHFNYAKGRPSRRHQI